MTPDDSARVKVRQAIREAVGLIMLKPQASWDADADEFAGGSIGIDAFIETIALRVDPLITTLEIQRDEAHVGHTMVSNTFKDFVPMVTYHSTAQNMLTCVRNTLAQARREAEGYRGDAVILGAELKSAQARLDRLSHEAEAAKERAHDAEEKVRMLEHVSMPNPPEDKVDGRAFRLTDDMATQQRERADRLAEALRETLDEIKYWQALGACGEEGWMRVLRHRALLTPPSPAKEIGK